MGKTDLIQSDSDKHFLHTSVLLRHASGDSGEAERQIETILTKAVVAKRRVWISSILFAELRPSTFVPGRFATLFELTRYLRSLATVVTPDPNTMMRAARLRDTKWKTPAGARQADEKPRSMSLSDAIQVASALWVKEVIGMPDLEFLMFDERSSDEGGAAGASRCWVLRTTRRMLTPARMRWRPCNRRASNVLCLSARAHISFGREPGINAA
jgi:hypothetical protein